MLFDSSLPKRCHVFLWVYSLTIADQCSYFPLIPLIAAFSAFNDGSFRSGSPPQIWPFFNKKKSHAFTILLKPRPHASLLAGSVSFFLPHRQSTSTKGYPPVVGIFCSLYGMAFNFFYPRARLYARASSLFEPSNTPNHCPKFFLALATPCFILFFAPRDQLAVVFASMEHLYKTVATYFLFFCEDRWRIHACARRNAA